MSGRRDDEDQVDLRLLQGLDQLSDLGDEQPPGLASMQMLVVSVQAEQRQRLIADLARFWAVAGFLLAGALWLVLRQPFYFLLLQASALLLPLLAGIWYLGWRRALE